MSTEKNQDCENFDGAPRTTLMNNVGKTYWTADEARSLECYNKGKFCFVEKAFADRETAKNYLEARFGGIIYNPADEPETIPPL
jgi:hypothetical protein